jgi:hypothetical protein
VSPSNEPALDPERSERLRAAIRRDIEAQAYDGCVLLVARRGAALLHEAIGFADRAMRPDDVFFSMSIAKQLTNTMVMMRVERGEISGGEVREFKRGPHSIRRGSDNQYVNWPPVRGLIPLSAPSLPPRPGRGLGRLKSTYRAREVVIAGEYTTKYQASVVSRDHA